MDIKQVAASALALVILAIVWGIVEKIFKVLNNKIHHKKIEFHGELVDKIVLNAVKSVYQTYVEKLKADGKFDEVHQGIALNKAVEIIKRQLTKDTKAYIKEHFGDVDVWVAEYVQSTIYDLKRH